MIHFFWSVFFLGCIAAMVLFYIGSALSILFMMHFIIKRNWYDLAGTYTSGQRLFRIIGKFFLYLFIPTLVAFGYLTLASRLHNKWDPYVDSEYAIVF